MNSYKNIKDTAQTDAWFRSQGLNPYKCTNPDLDSNFIRAKLAASCLLKSYKTKLSEKQIKQLNIFKIKTKATSTQAFLILNLYKKIRRQEHRQKKV